MKISDALVSLQGMTKHKEVASLLLSNTSIDVNIQNNVIIYILYI
jgi:hypothetical protein